MKGFFACLMVASFTLGCGPQSLADSLDSSGEFSGLESALLAAPESESCKIPQPGVCDCRARLSECWGLSNGAQYTCGVSDACGADGSPMAPYVGAIEREGRMCQVKHIPYRADVVGCDVTADGAICCPPPSLGEGE